ncbi:hypothetical protein PoB_004673500 [Plakobranchus ocellatus]|uniref:Uncharacterized protein n=1 Tax=Plakobranchus ocellatus TaxID=259542 RepID=A0AAV4BI64_9GAST|nr:hypothetical protein PoB_004673500 [Plakobranchus ocellatus]
MTLLVASIASILPLLNEGQGLPSVDFSTVTIQFGGNSLQEFYDCLCEDNMEECTMHYFNIFVMNVVGRSKQDMLSSIPREVTFGCNRPFALIDGSRRYSCELQQESTTQPQTLAITIGVSGGILVILNISAIIAFFYWRSKKGKTNQDRNLEPARANHLHGTSDYSVLDAGNNAIGNRPPEHIYNNLPSISGRVGNESENNTVNGQYSQYSEISDIRTVENQNNISLGQHSLYTEPVESGAVENEPENNINTGQLSLYSEPVARRSEVNTAQSNEYATIA